MLITNRVLLDSFIGVVAARLGLRIDQRLATEVIARRALARGLTVGRYLCELDEPGELRALTGELTVGETYFFRHAEQLDAFVDHALPARLAARAHDRRLRVMSAGCSSGEEPYTLAMLLHDRMPADWQVELHGVDIDARALRRAAEGSYSRWSLRAVPPAVEARWFQPANNASVLSAELRARVHLAEVNLAADVSPWQRPWDLVFCRNVLMYFTEDQADALIARIVESLAPGGYLFLGHAEIVWSRSAGKAGMRSTGALAKLETCSSHGTFYYRRRDAEPRLAGARGLRSLAGAGGPVERARCLALRTAALDAQRHPGRRDGELAAFTASTGDEQEHQLQRALMQLAQIGLG